MAVAEEWPVPVQPAGAATMMTQRVNRVPLLSTRGNVAVATVVIVSLMACWTRYVLRYPALPSRASVQQRSSAVEQHVPVALQPFDMQAPQLQGAIRSDGKFAPIRAAAGAELPKLPKPSPIVAYRSAEESLPATVQPDEAMHVSTKIGTAKTRNPRPHFASMHHSTKFRTAASKRGPAGDRGRRIGTKSRMTATNPRQATSPAARHPGPPGFGSEIGDTKLPPAPQENVPEPSSPTAQLNESPNKGRPAERDQSGSHRFGEAGPGESLLTCHPTRSSFLF